jgi:hypothetical protein
MKNPFPKKYVKALNALYKSNNVGRSVKQRYYFWEKTYPSTNIYHIPLDDFERRLKVSELDWLSVQFANEFTFC